MEKVKRDELRKLAIDADTGILYSGKISMSTVETVSLMDYCDELEKRCERFRGALKDLLASKILIELPFADYSEALHNAHEVLTSTDEIPKVTL